MKIRKILSLMFSISTVVASSFNCHATEGKVAFVGDSPVGKTCILCKMNNKNFDIGNVEATICAANFNIHGNSYGTECDINIIDISGLSRYSVLVPELIQNVSMSVVCASVDDYSSIESVPKWIDMCRKYSAPGSTIILVVTKSDLDNNETNINKETLINIAKEKCIGIMFTSAKTGEGIQELKNKIIEICHPLIVQESQQTNQCEEHKECLLI